MKWSFEGINCVVITLFLVIITITSCGGGSNNNTPSQPGNNSDSSNSIETDTSIPQSNFNIEPSNTVNVNEELFFDASATTDDKELFEGGKYEWDFGDGYSLQDPEGGITTTHTYTRPGTYTVTLTVTDTDGNSNAIQQDVTVSGEYTKLAPRPAATPLLELKFEDNILDSSGNNLNGVWQTNTGSFVAGIEGKALDLTTGNSIRIDNTDSLGGLGQLTISLWFKKEDSIDTGYLLRKFDSNSSASAIDMRIKSAYYGARPSYYGAHLYTSSVQGHCHTNSESQYIDNTLWHHYALTYDGQAMRIYIDGTEITSDEDSPLALTGSLINSSDPLYIGSNRGSDVFNGYIDEIKIYDTALTPQEIFTGFEAWHADFHGHRSQYIYVQIPGELRSDTTNTIHARITGDNNYLQQLSLNNTSDVLTLIDNTKSDLSNLKAEEKILLNNMQIPGATGKYTLTIQIKNASDDVIDTISEPFYKTYDGEPKVSIDKNNAIRVNGELFFPIGPTGLNNANINNPSDDYYRDWEGNGYINVLRSQGFWPTDVSASAWEEYISISDNLMAIGPARWEGLVNHKDMRPYWRNADINNLIEYVNKVKDHRATFMWNWASEPDLGDDSTYVPAPVVRSWTYKTHQLDPQHLVTITFAGHYWTEGVIDYHVRRRHKYQAPTNAAQFGKGTQIYNGTQVGDVYEIDYYPLEWAAPHSRGATNALLISALDKFYEETKNLVPLMSLVETTDIREGDGGLPPPTPWHPTPEQLKMMIWINVVHEAKGLGWFHYHTRTPEANFAVMAEFVDDIEQLTPVILGPQIDTQVSVEVTGGAQGDGRIDTMIREYNGKHYLFAVRVSETEDDANPAYIEDKPLLEGGQEFGYPDPIQNYPVTATFTIEGFNDATIQLHRENNRTLNMSGGQFVDTFEPYDVHIYEITPASIVADDGKTWPEDHGEASVSLWKDDKLAAYSFTIDDNAASDIDWWLEQSDTYGHHFTWFIITENIGTGSFGGEWSDFQKAFNAGHDIQSHTVTHNDGVLTVEEEYEGSINIIEANITADPGNEAEVTKAKVNVLAYPNGLKPWLEDEVDSREVAENYFIGARGTSGHINKADEIDYFDIDATSRISLSAYEDDGDPDRVGLPNLIIRNEDYPRTYRGWGCLLTHGVDDTLKTELIELFDYFDEHEDKFWVGLFRDVLMYARERDTAQINITSVTNNEIRFQVTDSLDNQTFDYPLTIKVRIDNSWNQVTATQNGSAIDNEIVERNGNKYVLVQVIPDAGEVVLSKQI